MELTRSNADQISVEIAVRLGYSFVDLRSVRKGTRREISRRASEYSGSRCRILHNGDIPRWRVIYA